MRGTRLSFYLVLNTLKLAMVTRAPGMGGEKVMRQISSEFGGWFCVHKCEFP